MQKPPVSQIRELTDRLNHWRHEYYNLNAPMVSDAVYDRHFDELKRLEDATGFHIHRPGGFRITVLGASMGRDTAEPFYDV